MTLTDEVTAPAWAGTIDVEDTRLFVRDAGGPGRPVVFLNGCYADTSHWRRIVQCLDPDVFRVVMFDERARGKSGTSQDYSFDACLRDITSVVAARQLERPILVGWSYGAYLAVYYAAAHPDLVAGVVSVDGAMPFGLTGADGQEKIRRLFKRMAWLFPIASRLGLAARMSAAQHAEVNIESNQRGADCAPVLESLTCPVRYVLGTGGHLGVSAHVMAQCRASLDPVLANNPRIQVAVQVPSNHSKIPSRHPDAVAAAIRDIASVTATPTHQHTLP